MNTKITYLYRDAYNYKMENECIIEGTLTKKQIRTILNCCNLGRFFIPLQIGLPERRFPTFDPEADHCWFELEEDSFEKVRLMPTIDLTAAELINRFEASRDNWQDVKYAPKIGEMSL